MHDGACRGNDLFDKKAALLLTAIFCLALAGRVHSWPLSQLVVEIGSGTVAEDGLALVPNANGQILLSVLDHGILPKLGQRASFSFTGTTPPVIYLVWRRSDSGELFQHGFATGGLADSYFDLNSIAEWRGELQSLEFGFLVPPDTQVTLTSLHIARPSMAERFKSVLHDWTTFRAWVPADINIYIGTAKNVGPHPAQVTGIFALIAILVYFAARPATFRLGSLMLIVFVLWVILDGFWQWRLWQQVSITRERFAGLDSLSKVVASEDAGVARLAYQAQEVVQAPNARIFVASQSDGIGMRAAYYLSPVNVFWYRRGPELPDAKYLRSGDYILVLAPSVIEYQREAGRIRFSRGDELAVIERLSSDRGVLLEVVK